MGLERMARLGRATKRRHAQSNGKTLQDPFSKTEVLNGVRVGETLFCPSPKSKDNPTTNASSAEVRKLCFKMTLAAV